VQPDRRPTLSGDLLVAPAEVERLATTQLRADDDLQVGQNAVVEFRFEA
jgi:hypothetical protein